MVYGREKEVESFKLFFWHWQSLAWLCRTIPGFFNKRNIPFRVTDIEQIRKVQHQWLSNGIKGAKTPHSTEQSQHSHSCKSSQIKKMYTKLIITFLLLCCCVYSTFATYGLDLSYFQGDVSVGTFQCLAASGYEFAILEGTAGNSGVVNPHLGSILNSAKSAGIRYVDVYVFLDFERGDPRGQIQEVVTAIRNSGAPFDGMIWHDVGLFPIDMCFVIIFFVTILL